MNKETFIKNHFFRPEWYSILVNPYFIDRYSLYKNIRNFANTVAPRTKILDVGCGDKPYKHLFAQSEYLGIEIAGGGHNDKEKKSDQYYDGKNIPFGDKIFDVVLCTQVLEHTEDPQGLTKEMYRVLKPGGRIFLTMPFIGNEHEQPYDFWRFTQFAHKKIMHEIGFTGVEIKPTCKFFSTLGQLTCSFIFESVQVRSTALKLLLSLAILAPIQTLAILLDLIFKNSRITLNYAVTAKKND